MIGGLRDLMHALSALGLKSIPRPDEMLGLAEKLDASGHAHGSHIALECAAYIEAHRIPGIASATVEK